MAWWPPPGDGGPPRWGRLVAAVSDGHGSRRCFRSGDGAALAVRAALALGRAALDTGSLWEGSGGERLGALIVTSWVRQVGEDLARHPFRSDELAIAGRADAGAVAALESNPLLAYGATLILALIDGPRGLVLQLGDGDVLLAGTGAGTASSAPAARPVPPDQRLFAGETSSLCQPGAQKEIRMEPLATGDGPQALLLATDGLGNAYPDDDGLLAAGGQLLAWAQAGPDAAVAGLEAWLAEASRFSGDDATAVLLAL